MHVVHRDAALSPRCSPVTDCQLMPEVEEALVDIPSSVEGWLNCEEVLDSLQSP